MHPWPIALALAATVAVPLAFGVRGPVQEHRLGLAVGYAAVYAVAWSASLLLGFLGTGAVALGACGLVAAITLAAAYAWRDERRLARFDERVREPATRARAIASIRRRVEEFASDGRAAVALAEIAGFPIRRLVAHRCYEDALALLDAVETRLSGQLDPVDRSEARLMRARVLLQLGRPQEAARLLGEERARGTRCPAEMEVLEALLEVCRRGRPRAAAIASCGSAWDEALVSLVRAHEAAAAGDEDRAARELAGLLRRPYGAAALDLARTCPGPASDLAEMLARPGAPYRRACAPAGA